jgi:hypothetical protein
MLGHNNSVPHRRELPTVLALLEIEGALVVEQS